MDLQSDPAVLLLDKPTGPTSRDAVDHVENELNPGKAGHGGTLDPKADGLLPILLNDATRLMEYLHSTSKTYEVTVRFDKISETLDLEGELRDVELSKTPGASAFEAILSRFEGSIEQIPPDFSALKKDGERYFELKRAGKDVEPDARTVIVHSLELLSFDWPAVSLQIECGKGFYVRALARDIALELDLPGAVLTTLRRTEYGPYSLDQAASLDSPETWKKAAVSAQTLLKGFPTITCDGEQRRLISHGSWIRREDETPDTDWAVAVNTKGQLLAMMKPATRQDEPFWWPKKVFTSA